MSTDHELSGDFGQQLALTGVPVEGELYSDRRSGTIGCVIRVRSDTRRTWVTVRRHGSATDCTLEQFHRYWQRCRPDGSLV